MFSISKKIMVFFMCVFQFFLSVFTMSGFKTDAYFTEWTAQDVYSLDDTIVLEKQAGEDFVVLNLTDIQINDGEALTVNSDYSYQLIDELIARTNPDLIAIAGDNLLGFLGSYAIVEKLASLDIPWAIVMGNHDGQDTIVENWPAKLAADADNSLFSFGPRDMGFGNYIINIKQGDEIIHSLYMMDTHSNNTFTAADGDVVEGYDHLWPNQIEWYKWAVNGLAELEGKTVQSTIMFHIPVCEYTAAAKAVFGDVGGTLNPEYADVAFGEWNEGVCSAPVNNGFFDVVKELGSTKDILVGHDHTNSFSILYEGVRLSYVLKTGFGSYDDVNNNGGSVLTIHDDGTTDFEHIYITPDELGFDIDDLN